MRDYDLEPVLMDADYRYSRIVSLFNIDKSRRKRAKDCLSITTGYTAAK